ncbi:conserved hypothetical protein [Ricinus communis]|uniref:Uncharacterized protein n=1 Tax=Ricinus communis TaxID=3988 RepID=B9R9H8_RICCO|nr:conserved hypothetical protein [Ricinus communis]
MDWELQNLIWDDNLVHVNLVRQKHMCSSYQFGSANALKIQNLSTQWHRSVGIRSSRGSLSHV